MTDSGVVMSVQGDLAQIRVSCTDACADCSASSLCKGVSQNEGYLDVKNPVGAHPGDEVRIAIPESNYNRALILLFGSLLAAAVAGAFAGTLVAAPLALPPSQSGFLGLLLGLGVMVPVMVRYFRRINLKSLYPVILDITKKGDCHG